ncbi:DUF695 domain-containing protein [Ramlibacter pallidus]|uniref:DUF695 domain-containing protein n=1 Tax=Ramlibacter pallidus TaxID=2780087 RepID=A0ABR9S3B7_9BURK|nr:DUF695 domain-containing protein [Ramlibacter pallidus]MBE7368005.1 DUF695 domain-containing protein [Ramlibacter pallidus]
MALPTPASASPSDVVTWATATSRHKTLDRAIVFRFAKDFRPGFRRADLPHRAIVMWRYTSDSGMPGASEREDMDRLEDLLAPLVERPGVALLALVSTGENLREWIFYARSEDQFMELLNMALRDQKRFPIEIDIEQDAEWSTYDRFRKGVRE